MLALTSCNDNNKPPFVHTKKINEQWLDSITKNSDSSFIRNYHRTDFVTAAYYISNKDSTICNVMRDSLNYVRQIIISKNDKRIYFAQYYANGQQVMETKLDSYGQYNDSAFSYYENGVLKSEGIYKHGLSVGIWKEYNEKGDLKRILNYDSNVVIIKQ
jgi:antitoxin component YwqK of YwqJK toxin-antitoxin module